LAVLLNTGWIGGAVFWLMTGLTLILGLRHLARDTPTRPLFLVLYAAFLANALEGLIIDLDHWRHYYLLMGLMWGCMTAQWHRLPGGDHPGHRAA